MAVGKSKHRILVAGGTEKVRFSLSELLPRADYEFSYQADSAAEARRLMLDGSVDIVILIAPLRDEFGTQLAVDMTENNVGVLLVVGSDVFDQVCYRVEDSGVVTLARPISRQSFYAAVKMLTAVRGRLLRMEQKNQALQEKMRDIRTVNRAKWLLIAHMQMSESDAHYYIEKQAMDTRMTRREVAENIIRSYDE